MGCLTLSLAVFQEVALEAHPNVSLLAGPPTDVQPEGRPTRGSTLRCGLRPVLPPCADVGTNVVLRRSGSGGDGEGGVGSKRVRMVFADRDSALIPSVREGTGRGGLAHQAPPVRGYRVHLLRKPSGTRHAGNAESGAQTPAMATACRTLGRD